MKRDGRTRKDVTVRIDEDVRDRARVEGINISRFLEAKLEAELFRAAAERELSKQVERHAAELTERLRREGVLAEHEYVAFDTTDILQRPT